MRAKRSTNTTHLSLMPMAPGALVRPYTGRLRKPPVVYAFGARVRFWAALGASLLFLACEYGKHAL